MGGDAHVKSGLVAKYILTILKTHLSPRSYAPLHRVDRVKRRFAANDLTPSTALKRDLCRLVARTRASRRA
jgi:hypothetical protein